MGRINNRHRDHLSIKCIYSGPTLTFHVPEGHYSDLHLLVLVQQSHLHSPLSPTIPWSSPASSDRSCTISARGKGRRKKFKIITVVSQCVSGNEWCSSTVESQEIFLNLHKPLRYQPLQIEQCPCPWSLQCRITTPTSTSLLHNPYLSTHLHF